MPEGTSFLANERELLSIFDYTRKLEYPVMHGDKNPGAKQTRSEQRFDYILQGVGVTKFVWTYRSGENHRGFQTVASIDEKFAGIGKCVSAMQYDDRV